jgi:Rieske Fe-S protein
MGAVSDKVERPNPIVDVPRLSPRTRAGRWQAEFPFGWDADDLVNRRQMLRWSVGVAGTLFAMTGLLAGLGFARARTRGEPKAIIAADRIEVGGVHYFDYPGTDVKDRAILLRLEENRYVAYNRVCTHLSCEVYWDPEAGEIHCPCHNGRFQPETGEVIAGPPPRPLPVIRLRNEGGTIYAVEEVTRNV